MRFPEKAFYSNLRGNSFFMLYFVQKKKMTKCKLNGYHKRELINFGRPQHILF